MTQPLHNSLFGYMVLRATHRVPTLPPLDQTPIKLESVHLEGSYFGTVVNGCNTEPATFYYPQRSRSRRIFSATSGFYEYNDETTIANLYSELEKQDPDEPYDLMVEETIQNRIQGPHMLAVDQFGSNANLTLMVRNVELNLYGLHCDDYDLLIWSNINNYASVLYQNGLNTMWLYSFKPIENICRVLHTRRICSRWYRWGKDFNPLQRFAALERMLLGRART